MEGLGSSRAAAAINGGELDAEPTGNLFGCGLIGQRAED